MNNTLQNAAGTVGLKSSSTGALTAEQPAHPHRGFLSRAVRLLGRVNDYCAHLGLASGLRWYSAKLLARAKVPGVSRVRMKPPQLTHPVSIRMYPSSDDFVFDQIFIKQEYGALCASVNSANIILDLGANVGYASALLASRYPSARIVSVEPDPGNYRECVANLAPYGGRVTTLLGAVWARPAMLTLERGMGCDGREWATRVSETSHTGNAQVQAWDMPALLDMAGVPVVDILKIDIEGSEVEVFAANTAEWLPRVRNICIELHDEQCRHVFFGALRGFDYEVQTDGEYTLCLNLRPAA